MKRMLSLAALLFLLLLPAGCGITSNAQELPPEVQETLEDLSVLIIRAISSAPSRCRWAIAWIRPLKSPTIPLQKMRL